MNSPVCIIVVNWNNWRDTLECLESLLHLDYPTFHIVLVDNGSSDDSVVRILSWARGTEPVPTPSNPKMRRLSQPPVRKPIAIYENTDPSQDAGPVEVTKRIILCRVKENCGFAAGVNAGLEHACRDDRFSYFWVINNDVVVEQNALSALVMRIEESPDAGMCGSTVMYYENPDKAHAFGGARYFPPLGLAMHIGRFRGKFRDLPPASIERQMAYVFGAAILITRRFVEAVGFMNESYFLYYEELDWALRAKPEFKLAYASKSVLYHKAGASAGSSRKSGDRSLKSEYFLMRNKLWITRRYYPFWLPFVLAGLLLTWAFHRINGNQALAGADLKALHHGLAHLEENHQ